MGKTALATKIAGVMADRGHGVGFVSLEMTADDLWLRIASDVSQVPYRLLRAGRLDAGTWHAYQGALDLMAAWPLHILDERGLTVEDIRRHARRLRTRMQSRGITMGALVVDYVGLVTPTDTRPSRQIQVGHISRTLRAIAKELDVVVLLLSQLNRDSEKRASGRPSMADLRESGDLEQDADAVVLCYRDEVVNPESTKFPGVGEINLAKWRHGEPGTVYLDWHGDRVTWGTRELDAETVRAGAGGSW
jgi:replicative DNA helicase